MSAHKCMHVLAHTDECTHTRTHVRAHTNKCNTKSKLYGGAGLLFQHSGVGDMKISNWKPHETSSKINK